MKYNTDKFQLIIPEYGRHIHTMAKSLIEIKDDKKRNQQAQVLINIMGNLNPHLRDAEEYKHKLWDHLFTMCEGKLDVTYTSPKAEKEEKKEDKLRIHNTQGSVKNKHYGKLILLLIQEAVKIKDSHIKNYAVDQIAQQMKRAYLNWNQTNVQDIQIWNDLEKFSEKKLDLDKTKIIPVFQQVQTRKKTFFKKNNKKNYSKK
tara:strand:- start:5050 stop:5655 length:606 start_codon:yes stop_codon:yes gene_type:complete